MDAAGSTLAADVTLPSPLIGRAVFKGRDDVLALLRIVYSLLGAVRWQAPVGEGSRWVGLTETRVAGMRIDDAMVFELDGEGMIVQLRPHLRPLLATIVFFLLIGPRVAPQPGLLLRALRA
jgi:hypothetical protein